jgi:hypothetical protein
LRNSPGIAVIFAFERPHEIACGEPTKE